MPRIAFATALVLAASTASADVPPDGILAAAQDDNRETTTIYRIKPTAIEKVGTHKTSGLSQAGWTDASTLWVFANDLPKLSVAKLVGGKLAETIDIPVTEWKFDKVPEDLDVELHITATKQVWLEHCLKRKGDLYNEHQCVKGIYLRVDAKPFVRATTKPKQIDSYRVMKNFQEGTPKAFPRAKAPAGYTVKLGNVLVTRDGEKPRKFKGATCTAPTKTAVSWPGPDEDLDFAMKPKQTTWLRTSPPVARIAGKATNPIGIVEDHEAYFFQCSELVNHAEFFGDGVWGIRRGLGDGTWSIYLEDKLLGTVKGESLRVAPR